MFLVFFIQAYIAFTGMLTSFIGSSLNLFSQSAFDLILDIPTVAYFFSTVHNSSDANTPVVASTGNESTTDICTWGIPGLLALRPVALPPSIINVPTRELQLYHAHSLALSLIVRDPASCPFLGPQITDDSTTESLTEPILKTSTEMNITTTSLPASNDDLSNDSHATAALVLRLIFISGLCSIGMLGTVVFVEIARQRIQDMTDSCESTVSFFSITFCSTLCLHRIFFRATRWLTLTPNRRIHPQRMHKSRYVSLTQLLFAAADQIHFVDYRHYYQAETEH